jgi:hypothetical protein
MQSITKLPSSQYYFHEQMERERYTPEPFDASADEPDFNLYGFKKVKTKATATQPTYRAAEL